jgi:hypothetical protein
MFAEMIAAAQQMAMIALALPIASWVLWVFVALLGLLALRLDI